MSTPKLGPGSRVKRELGAWIRRARREREWSQARLGQEVAAALGTGTAVAKETVLDWEKARALPGELTLGALATIFGPMPDSILVALGLSKSSAGAPSRPRAAPDAARCAEVLKRLQAAVDELAALMEDDGQGEEHGRAAGGPR